MPDSPAGVPAVHRGRPLFLLYLIPGIFKFLGVCLEIPSRLLGRPLFIFLWLLHVIAGLVLLDNGFVQSKYRSWFKNFKNFKNTVLEELLMELVTAETTCRWLKTWSQQLNVLYICWLIVSEFSGFMHFTNLLCLNWPICSNNFLHSRCEAADQHQQAEMDKTH